MEKSKYEEGEPYALCQKNNKMTSRTLEIERKMNRGAITLKSLIEHTSLRSKRSFRQFRINLAGLKPDRGTRRILEKYKDFLAASGEVQILIKVLGLHMGILARMGQHDLEGWAYGPWLFLEEWTNKCQALEQTAYNRVLVNPGKLTI
jgi:hypothetical protein